MDDSSSSRKAARFRDVAAEDAQHIDFEEGEASAGSGEFLGPDDCARTDVGDRTTR